MESNTAKRNASILTLVWFTISKEQAWLLWKQFTWENQTDIPSCIKGSSFGLVRVTPSNRNLRKRLSQEAEQTRTERRQVRSWRFAFSLSLSLERGGKKRVVHPPHEATWVRSQHQGRGSCRTPTDRYSDFETTTLR